MFKISMGLLPHRADANDLSYVDLGSGTGGKLTVTLCACCSHCPKSHFFVILASAIHLTEKHSLQISKATCVNLCHEQNIVAKNRISELDLSGKIDVVDASFDETPCPSNHYDLAFSQDGKFMMEDCILSSAHFLTSCAWSFSSLHSCSQ